MSSFKTAINLIREKSNNDVELGTAFEKLSKVFFENDSTQKEQYSKVWHYEDWAKLHDGYATQDIGIDLVAKLRNEEGYCAIQCKCYKSDYSISKSDLDSFISASSTQDFKRLILIDTSTQRLGKNAESVFSNLNKEYIRIQLAELEDSLIDWISFIKNEKEIRFRKKKDLRDDQLIAVKKVIEGFSNADRGKMIMACGTGKTFTSLKIAEEFAGSGKLVLYMVPSLALMSQTIREWKNDSIKSFNAFSACSDKKVGKRKDEEDQIGIKLSDLSFPATTDSKKLSDQIILSDTSKMTVVFSTYQSINVISDAQKKYNLKKFDLIICDEAHRTTGATLIGEDESNFVRIHDDEYINGSKRLYMTATPRIYGEMARKKEDEGKVNLASMDDEKTFGKTFIYRSFSWAVENDLLTDYKVVVLMMDEQVVSDKVQKSFVDGVELKLDDVTKMVGCYKALAKVGLNKSEENNEFSHSPMKKALAFCQNIALSKLFASEFPRIVDEYTLNEKLKEDEKVDLSVELHHVDGTFNADERNEELSWLKEDTEDNICRVLSNAKCLSEGVDVPALDAIMFLHPRKSQIDVVQSVGRVMRKSEGKKLGYVILPIAVAPGVSPERALNDNKKYQVIWQILNALRAHDERFDRTINMIGLGEDVSKRIEIVEFTSVVEDVNKRKKKGEGEGGGEGTGIGGGDDSGDDKDNYKQLGFSLAELSQGIMAKIVDKCGTRDYWETWATDIAKIAQQHISRINSIVINSNSEERKIFLSFLEEIRDDLNPEITENDAVEMLAQHIITRPVFDSLFQGNAFTSDNAVSKAMEKVLESIYSKNIKLESSSLDKFYASVQKRAGGIITASGRQKLILELYDRFFRNAFPLMTQKLGIVYTPVEIVDFIVNSVEDVMNNEFDSSLRDENVHILDPFAGTGTFITRLLQLQVFTKDDLKKKFESQIHANEIVLLAYYIACINIESVYQDLVFSEKYTAFKGMVLTDTFQLYEQERDLIATLLPDNSYRRTRQKQEKINVIIANPPYSSGQTSDNDDAANLNYLDLDKRIKNSYCKFTNANPRSLYDSYIRAFRWASDKIEENGVIGFVTNAGWIDGNSTDGFRKCLFEEFSKIYIFHLRGNQRTSGEVSRKEGGKIFGGGSRAAIAITILVKTKNKDPEKKAEIYFCDIGDYLDRNQKLEIISNYKSIKEMQKGKKFKRIYPDKNNDWLNPINSDLIVYPILGNKKEKNVDTIFKQYSMGIKTNRDNWCINFSKNNLQKNMSSTINVYNDLLEGQNEKPTNDDTKLKWSWRLREQFQKKFKAEFNKNKLILSIYRPFTKQWLFWDPLFNENRYAFPSIDNSGKKSNLYLCVTGIGCSVPFSCLMTEHIPLQLDNCQCMPLRIYKNNSNSENLLFEYENPMGIDGITDFAINYFIDFYEQKSIEKEDVFFYIYAILHSKDYRSLFKNNLLKELPRIPPVSSYQDFKNFSKLGRELSNMHVNFERVDPYPVKIIKNSELMNEIENNKEFYKVEKMRFKDKFDKSVIKYNRNITVENIPLKSYEYLVNGKSAIEWVMDQQQISIDQKSGIMNNANDYANETIGSPSYPLDLLRKVINISIKTQEIIDSFPKLKY